eukprot:TRINITY_DN11293_c0_g1_i1.p2 TRINITY_DN11293_c0_g1~~TRINITY_DN11293_c0_g1_i1.p2  ORF type:complete len:175 (+),score=39.71 TRINITY_DN11293_c0_g1_i1:100-624(+)
MLVMLPQAVPTLPVMRMTESPTPQAAQEGQPDKRVRPCGHNSWDNVRVLKGEMTLRCRACQKQWKVRENVWKGGKCQQFTKSGVCPKGDGCTRLHVFTKKQGLQERISIHGEQVVVPQCTAKDPTSRRKKSSSPTQSSACTDSDEEQELSGDELRKLVERIYSQFAEDSDDSRE